MGGIKAPVVLDDTHELTLFDCGNPTLNEWLKKQSLRNQNSGASRTFVICQKKRVIGYYALASGSVERINAPGSIARNMPEPIPVTILGRLAIDQEFQSQRLGGHMLKDALLRTISVSKTVGIRAILVHAISEEAKSFYLNYGFIESPLNSMTLLLSIKKIKALL